MKSLLFVPANQEKYFKTVQKSDVKTIIIDLEDSVSSEDYQLCLKNIKKYLPLLNLSEVYIRIDSLHYQMHIEESCHLGITGYMVPKIEDSTIPLYINEKYPELKMILLFESINGISNMDTILEGVTNVEALAFGGEDYCLDFGCERTDITLFSPRIKMLEYGKLHKITVYDTIYPYVNDEQGFRDELQLNFSMGFDGKLLIHPKQLRAFEELTDRFYEKISDIIEKYEENVTKGKTVLLYNGRIYERNHISHYKKVLAHYLASFR